MIADHSSLKVNYHNRALYVKWQRIDLWFLGQNADIGTQDFTSMPVALFSRIHMAKSTDWKVTHGFTTTRLNEFSSDPYEGFNLALHVDDDEHRVQLHRESLRTVLGAQKLQFCDQCHTGNVGVVKNVNQTFPNTDALVTDKKDIALVVLTADCVPILIHDPVNNVAAAIHAGWKGTHENIVLNSVEVMTTLGADPKSCFALIGPHISVENYEVGEDLASKFKVDYPSSVDDLGVKPHLDLGLVNRIQLESAGIPMQNIQSSAFCTKSSPLFYSARRQGLKSGRQGAFIML